MLERTGDYLSKRAKELGLDRGEALIKVQAELDRLYPGQARAVSLNRQVLFLATANASLASELRLRQVELLKNFRALVKDQPINSLRIQIKSV